MLYSRSEMKKTPGALKLLLAAAALFYLLFILRSSFCIKDTLYFTLLDDAMVSMRYAQHLAQGYGLVWNIGEKPLEGFTNPGWMFFMAVLHLFPIPASKISLGVMVASAIVLLANLSITYRICEVIKPGAKYAPLLAAAITAFYFPLVFWSLRGMEVGVLVLLINLGTLAAIQLSSVGKPSLPVALSLFLFLALLVRMDAILQVLILVLYIAGKSRKNLYVLGIPLMVVILTILGILWFQHAYFGDALPNTYYQKLAGTSPFERIKNGLLVFNQFATRDTLLPALFVLVGVLLYKDLRNKTTLMLAGLFSIQCAYSIWVGGDYAEVEVSAANRFITQGMPALIILFSVTADHIITELVTKRQGEIPFNSALQFAIASGVAIALLLVISGTPWVNWGIDNAPMLKSDIRRVRVGLAIAEYTSPQATIAVHAAGQIPYFSQRKTIDLLGLNDAVIANGPVTGPFYPGHDKWDYDYSILELKPDLIADNWVKLGDFMRHEAEYRQLDNGIYIRKDSAMIDVNGLENGFR